MGHPDPDLYCDEVLPASPRARPAPLVRVHYSPDSYRVTELSPIGWDVPPTPFDIADWEPQLDPDAPERILIRCMPF